MTDGSALGLAAALGTAVCWSGTALFFSAGGRRIGSEAVNLTRLLLAVGLLVAAHRAATGAPLPLDVGSERLGWLVVSGVVGLVIGDVALFEAFVVLGPRLATVIMALAPLIAAVLGWAVLGERLAALQLAAIGMAVAGVATVVTEPPPGAAGDVGRHDRRGIALGLVGAVGQAGGLIASKLGMAGDYPALSATLVRIVVAAAVLWLLAALRGRVGRVVRAWRDHRALALTALGAVCGPFLGIWLSLFAVREAPVGLASAVMATSPILVLGVEALRGRPVTRRGLAGTAVAVGGVAAMFAVG
mgnify:CR=1 FL=1